jgi:hypothetical protein
VTDSFAAKERKGRKDFSTADERQATGVGLSAERLVADVHARIVDPIQPGGRKKISPAIYRWVPSAIG